MNLLRIWAVARKELLHVLRDARSLAMAIAIPMLLLVLFGYALTLDVDEVPVAVWDQNESPASRELLAAFDGSRYFSFREHVRNYSELSQALDARRAIVGLVIPSDFSRRMGARRSVSVQVIVDGSDANTATLAIGYAEAVVEGYSQSVTLAQIERVTGRRPAPPLEVRPRVWFNAELEGRNYIIPGLIAVIMMVIAATLTSGAIAREWERNTMEQIISTPLQGRELILGKLLPYFAIGLFDVVLAFLMGKYLFAVPFRGSVALLFLCAAFFLVGALALGILISIVARTQLLANQLAMLATFLPAFLLSGFLFAIRNMPEFLQWVTYLVPARYFITLLRGVYLKGIGLEILATEALLLVLFGTGLVLLATRTFQKKLI
ncbi:MAG TPA: ABC transporter permease [Terriglobia bacterium]